jgi:hypothetical protein
MEEEQMSLIDQFKQQMLKSWQPVATLTRTTITIFVLAAVFLGLGIPMLVINNHIKEYSLRYDDQCQTTCNLTLTITREIKGPIFVYYEIEGFFQNHRLYANSISYSQLKGENISESKALSDCDPIVYNKDLYVTTSITGAPLDPEAIANPCGMVAYTIFNDTFELRNGSESLSILSTRIAWPSDVSNFVVREREGMWYDISDERFINWVRIASMANFRKLWGRIEGSLS